MIREKQILSLDEIKELELEILVEFSSICEKHSLSYSLAYGTMLGAIRHKGFIPWDDDIDVMMPRPDYMRLLDICAKELVCTKYKIASMHNNPEYFSPLAKMYNRETVLYQGYGQDEGKPTGVYIDIFILDGLPNEAPEEFYRKAQEYRNQWGRSVRKLFAKHRSRNIFTDIGGSILALPYRLKGYKFFRDQYDSHCSQFTYDTSEEISVVIYGEGLKKEAMSKDEMRKRSKVFFEGKEYYAVKDPEAYLRRMYGNYMELPPLEQRMNKHPNKAYKLI